MSRAHQIADACTTRNSSTTNVIELSSRSAASDARFSKVDDLMERLAQDTQTIAKLPDVSD